MAGMYGADVGQLRALAAQFDRAADQLDQARLQVGGGIWISAWIGPFATSFRVRWDSEHSRRVASAAALLRANAQRARANADDQERTSAVDVRSVVPRAAADRPPAGYTAEQEREYELALDFLKTAIGAHGTIEDGADLIAALKSGALDLKSFSGWLQDVKGLDAGAILGLAGMGITAHELGVAIGNDDPAAVLEASLDLAMGAVGVKVPGAGLAWDFGKMLGETGYTTLQQFYDSPSSALDAVARDLYGETATFDSISQAQRDQLMKRYEGIAGPFVSLGDHAHGAWDDFWTWVLTGKGRGPRR
ncbi:MAG: hypothetical protein QM804_13730 [Propionicimonas sp.]